MSDDASRHETDGHVLSDDEIEQVAQEAEKTGNVVVIEQSEE